MNFRILVLSFLALAFLAGCNQNSSSSSARLKKRFSMRRGIEEYFYTPDNKIDYVRNSNGTKTTYKFSGNTVVLQTIDTVSGRSATSSFYVNGNGYADSMVTVQGPATYLTIFKHAADGSIAGIEQYVAGSLRQVSKNDVKSGNKASSTISDSSGKTLGTIYYEYYPDKQNSIDYGNQGMKFIGSESKNLEKKNVTVRAEGDTISIIDFAYHFDDKGRVSSQVVSRNKMMLDSTVYTYY
jgi:hypothetical protein